MVPCPDPYNLSAYVLERACVDPDKVALAICGPARAERWSYGRLEHAVRAVGAGLLATGLKPGDQVLLRLGNNVSFPLAFLGAVAVGIIPIPTSAQLTAAELERMVTRVTPKAVIQQPALPQIPNALPHISSGDIELWASDAPHGVADYLLGAPNRMAYIMFTSGTSSGTTKAVAHAHRAIWARRMMFEDWYGGLTADDRLLHGGALNWTFTLGTGLLDPWTVGATALVPADGTALEALPLLLSRHDATLFAAAPGVLRRLLRSPDRLNLPKLRHTLTAGEHLHDDLRRTWEHATGRGLYDAFGMTECSTFLSASPLGAPSLTPQRGRRATVQGDGTLAIHKDEMGLMLGYLNDGELELPLHGDWFVTSDRATQAHDGRIIYEGRIGDLLNPGGYRVSPLEVEQVLAGVPGLVEFAVTELRNGTATYLAACYTADRDVAEADIASHVSSELAAYKHPRRYLRVDALPRGTNGKLQRQVLPTLFDDS